ncbi:MAG: hypothetical protein ACLTMP_02840 [Eggerthella lenta]
MGTPVNRQLALGSGGTSDTARAYVVVGIIDMAAARARRSYQEVEDLLSFDRSGSFM